MNSPVVASIPVSKVLVVEDAPAWREHLARLIRRTCPSAQVQLAVTYEEAMEALAGNTAWGLIVTDVALSESDVDGLGMFILRRAREKGLPVIVVSITEKVRARGAVSAERCGARFFSKWELTRDQRVERDFVEHVRQVLTDQQRTRQTRAVNVFVSYAHEDEEFCESLEEHLAVLKRQEVISVWNDRRIRSGTEWRAQIDKHLNDASLILLLVSSCFIASEYCYDVEMKCAMQRHESRQARVIPIILRPCEWHSTPFAKLQPLPKDGKPVTLWLNRDEAFLDIAQGIHQAAKEQQQLNHTTKPLSNWVGLTDTRTTAQAYEQL